MNPDRASRLALPESARQNLDDFAHGLGVELRLWATTNGGPPVCLYPGPSAAPLAGTSSRRPIRSRDGTDYTLELAAVEPGQDREALAGVIASVVERTLDFAKEIRFFTAELSERYEEINLLYSISETLGSVLKLEDAARIILQEVCDVLGARRGSLWVHEPGTETLVLTASVGEGGRRGPIRVSDENSVTARVFRESQSLIVTREFLDEQNVAGVDLGDAESVLLVPVSYTPPSESPRTVGVINLIGRQHGGRFTAADQKLLAAIASQVGSALENNRLIRQSLARERMAREMELAHHLQQKLLPSVEGVPGVRVSARVEPAEMVGGDFYQVFPQGGRIGVMIGDVSSHGFPAALIMALSMSAASIYASESNSPGEVLRRMDDALQDELETTEMYVSLFYGVLDPEAGTLTYSNAGHPHAFLVRADGQAERLLATDSPVGFAGPDAYGEACSPWDPDTDRLLLFTDGLSDTLTSVERPDGESLVLETVRDGMNDPPSTVVGKLFELTRDARPTVPSDDRTAVVVAGP
jgi:sigma-B regulation protein RsbU (phosphoserine phosphatase)